jgi:hypothetical protein
MGLILRSKATKNLIVTGSAEILRGVYPEPVEGLRMTCRSFRMETNYRCRVSSDTDFFLVYYYLHGSKRRPSTFSLSYLPDFF